MDLSAKITGITYTPLLCASLKHYAYRDFLSAILTSSAFILDVTEENSVAVSVWLSPKRSRSYPYARVYDTLGFSGKKIAVIPVMKDEGKDGDRDFLQWDTVSLMSLLGIYVIIAYYTDAEKNTRYGNKITDQHFDVRHIKERMRKIFSYQSDALHWNMEQIDTVGECGRKALRSYRNISKKTGVMMHSRETALKRIQQLQGGREKFMHESRRLAEAAQKRESVTVQPKEHVRGVKGAVTIRNYLGGLYYFTSDEITARGKDVFLIEAKHSRTGIPSAEDIKDGLIKMILYTNLKYVRIGDKNYNAKPVLKLTTGNPHILKNLSTKRKQYLDVLKKEAKINRFTLQI